ncbi:RraA family protein [Hydrogenophaga sp.]|uniref:RraA family protein n=1 Tax=Hydrogenophaga sp. TaxID=1904254 RepID=UPI002720320F|nr:RraA family protein [Hydrogenophaga sp.]MDO9437003.1 RraA family protein [Hydrogenophaga sp.]
MDRSKVFLRVNRVDPDLCDQARKASLSDLHEAMGYRGRAALMSPRMRPLRLGQRVVGPAVTAWCAPGDNLMMHRALYLAQAGDVLVVVCGSETSGAQWGDVAARYAKQKGLAGVVVQGPIRDVEQLLELDSQAWSTCISSIHPDKNGHGLVNAPIVCDGVLVQPGDMVVADSDGVLVIPRDEAPQIVARGLARMKKEEEAAMAIGQGATPWDLSGASAIYAEMQIDERDCVWDSA